MIRLPILLVFTLLIPALLTGCGYAPQVSPIPTPTTIATKLLTVEGLLRGEVCNELESEYELFFISSEDEWNDILAQTLKGHTVSDSDLAQLEGQTDFQTHRLLLALRTCHSNIFYAITIDRVVSVANQLYIYVELTDPAPSIYLDTYPAGDFYLVRIPWSQENSDNPTLESVDYRVFVIVGQPVE
jgi:hypothetical protein